jgi:hypothetical protein
VDTDGGITLLEMRGCSMSCLSSASYSSRSFGLRHQATVDAHRYNRQSLTHDEFRCELRKKRFHKSARSRITTVSQLYQKTGG